MYYGRIKNTPFPGTGGQIKRLSLFTDSELKNLLHWANVIGSKKMFEEDMLPIGPLQKRTLAYQYCAALAYTGRRGEVGIVER